MKTKLKKLLGLLLHVTGAAMHKVGASFVSVSLAVTKHAKKFKK